MCLPNFSKLRKARREQRRQDAPPPPYRSRSEEGQSKFLSEKGKPISHEDVHPVPHRGSPPRRSTPRAGVLQPCALRTLHYERPNTASAMFSRAAEAAAHTTMSPEETAKLIPYAMNSYFAAVRIARPPKGICADGERDNTEADGYAARLPREAARPSPDRSRLIESMIDEAAHEQRNKGKLTCVLHAEGAKITIESEAPGSGSIVARRAIQQANAAHDFVHSPAGRDQWIDHIDWNRLERRARVLDSVLTEQVVLWKVAEG
ncbi:MAG: hypothetical protein M4579_006574 [Chaenotheca gracillima]|nr:MAG: hypothetical protein M4579_006574 [Chaenotheca gracillima]